MDMNIVVVAIVLFLSMVFALAYILDWDQRQLMHQKQQQKQPAKEKENETNLIESLQKKVEEQEKLIIQTTNMLYQLVESLEIVIKHLSEQKFADSYNN